MRKNYTKKIAWAPAEKNTFNMDIADLGEKIEEDQGFDLLNRAIVTR